MTFFDLEFFIAICESGFKSASLEFGINKNDTHSVIANIEKYTGFRLFDSEKLTQNGRVFLKYSKDIMKTMRDCVLGVCDISPNHETLVFNLYADYCHNILLQSLKNTDFAGIFLDVRKYDALIETNVIDTHIILQPMSRRDHMFYERRWSIRVKQGLFASDRYLRDMGNRIPKTIDDLASHSVIALGNGFESELNKDLNWHLFNNSIEPAVVVSSVDVLLSAAEQGFGIAPVVMHHEFLCSKKLHRILPEIDGPDIYVDFAIRKSIHGSFIRCIEKLESELLKKIDSFGIEILYPSSKEDIFFLERSVA